VINLHIRRGASGHLDWYEDDGHSMKHLDGESHSRRITLTHKGTGAEVVFHTGAGSFTSRVRKWRVIVHATDRHYRVSGARVKTRFDRRRNLFAFEIENSPDTTEKTVRLS